MLKILKDILTTANGQDYDTGRVLWVLAVFVLVAIGGVQVMGALAHLFGKGLDLHLWSAEDWGYWGASIAVQLPAGGAALAMKMRTEAPYTPPVPPKPREPGNA